MYHVVEFCYLKRNALRSLSSASSVIYGHSTHTQLASVASVAILRHTNPASMWAKRAQAEKVTCIFEQSPRRLLHTAAVATKLNRVRRLERPRLDCAHSPLLRPCAAHTRPTCLCNPNLFCSASLTCSRPLTCSNLSLTCYASRGVHNKPILRCKPRPLCEPSEPSKPSHLRSEPVWRRR